MEFNRIITFGDSFTRGTELSDCIDISPGDIYHNRKKYSKELQILKNKKIGVFSELDLYGRSRENYNPGFSLKTWPALLADYFQLEYCCQSKSGSSNQTIIRTLSKFINDINYNDLVIIDWTFMDRWDYFDIEELIVEEQWKTLTPGSNKKTEIEKFYFKYIQSELWNKWESLRAIMLAKYMLMSRNIKCFMTCEDSLIFDLTYHTPSYVKIAQDEVKNDIFWFENNGFYQWAKENNFPLGKDNGHPLEEAHKAAFKYIIKNYNFT